MLLGTSNKAPEGLDLPILSFSSADMVLIHESKRCALGFAAQITLCADVCKVLTPPVMKGVCTLAWFVHALISQVGTVQDISVHGQAPVSLLLRIQADRLLLQVASFFFQLEDEAGVLKQAPSSCAVKLGNKAAGVYVLESGLAIEVVPPNDLKAPASTEETKVLKVAT